MNPEINTIAMINRDLKKGPTPKGHFYGHGNNPTGELIKSIQKNIDMKPRRRAVHAELRKESESFDGWLKYEVTIENPDGSIEHVPAYGKDLQDALSRVVHDQRVNTIEKKVIKKIPEIGWMLAWFLGAAFILEQVLRAPENSYTGVIAVGSVVLYFLVSLSIINWFNFRNRPRK